MQHIRPDGTAEKAPVAITLPKALATQRRHTAAKPTAAVGKLGMAREAVRNFLLKEFKARAVRVTKIGPAAGDPPGWYAEAEIMVPDLGIKSLGLPLAQDVLERELYAIDLDGDLDVKSYEVLDPRDR